MLKRVTAATVRAMSGRDEVTVNFSGAEANIDERGNKVRLPAPGLHAEGAEIARLRGVADAMALMGLVALVNWPLGALGEWLVTQELMTGELSLGRLFGWVLSPVAWFMGVDGWHDCQLFGRLLGIKVAVNEFIGFQELGTGRGRHTKLGIGCWVRPVHQ